MKFTSPSNDPNNNDPYSLKSGDDFSDIPLERRKVVKKQATKLFLVLLVGGLIAGGILALGLVQIIHKLGLADKPNHPLRFEQHKK